MLRKTFCNDDEISLSKEHSKIADTESRNDNVSKGSSEVTNNKAIIVHRYIKHVLESACLYMWTVRLKMIHSAHGNQIVGIFMECLCVDVTT